MALTYTIQPEATWGDGTPVTTDDVLFTWEVGRHPESGVSNAELYRRITRIDVVDDKTFTMHVDKLTFTTTRSTISALLPAHLERAGVRGGPGAPTARARCSTPTRPTRASLSAPTGSPRSRPAPHRARAQPDLVGRAADLRADRGQGDREHRRARGQPAVRRDRHDRGRARPVARPGAGLRAAPRRRASRSSTSRAWSTSISTSSSTTRSWPTCACARRCSWALDREAICQQLFDGPPARGRQPASTRWTGSTATTCRTTRTIRPRPAALLDEAGWTRAARRRPPQRRRASRCGSS